MYKVWDEKQHKRQPTALAWWLLVAVTRFYRQPRLPAMVASRGSRNEGNGQKEAYLLRERDRQQPARPLLITFPETHTIQAHISFLRRQYTPPRSDELRQPASLLARTLSRSLSCDSDLQSPLFTSDSGKQQRESGDNGFSVDFLLPANPSRQPPLPTTASFTPGSSSSIDLSHFLSTSGGRKLFQRLQVLGSSVFPTQHQLPTTSPSLERSHFSHTISLVFFLS